MRTLSSFESEALLVKTIDTAAVQQCKRNNSPISFFVPYPVPGSGRRGIAHPRTHPYLAPTIARLKNLIPSHRGLGLARRFENATAGGKEQQGLDDLVS